MDHASFVGSTLFRFCFWLAAFDDEAGLLMPARLLPGASERAFDDDAPFAMMCWSGEQLVSLKG